MISTVMPAKVHFGTETDFWKTLVHKYRENYTFVKVLSHIGSWHRLFITDKSLSEALLLAEHGGEHVVYKNCSECQQQFLYTTCSPQVWAWNFHVLSL